MKRIFVIDGSDVRPAIGVIPDDAQIVYVNEPIARPEITEETRFKKLVLKYSEAEGVHYEFDNTDTAAEERERIYSHDKCITIEGVNTRLTVDEATKLWQAYLVEDNLEKANEIKAAVKAAKLAIRAAHPTQQ